MKKTFIYKKQGIYLSFINNWQCLWKLRIYNPTKKRKEKIVFKDMKADMEAKKN